MIMDKREINRPLPLNDIDITDSFWQKEIELVRTEIIPYQWRALNDQVEGAEPSFCMRNFKIAGKQNDERHEKGSSYLEAEYTFRGFQALPEDMSNLEDKFYGFVFQDSDFYKWVEAVAYSLIQHPDKELEATADEAIDVVCKAQQDDGYLDTYYIINGKNAIFTNLRDNHELYCLGHLIEGAVAYYQATGKDKLLNAAKRFTDYVDNHFGPEEEKCKGYPGHELVEMALVRLYDVTGEKKYLRLSKFFVEQRGQKPYYFETEEHPNPTNEYYHQSYAPIREQDVVSGHAVRAVYFYSGVADIAREYNDDSLFETCDRLFDQIVKEKMYVTGGIGATHLGEAFSFPFDLPNDTAYAETCASIGMMFYARRMLQIKPDSKYSDIMELELYNTVLSGMALDGKSFFYVNPLEVLPEACHSDERKFHVKDVRQKWFGCACCPPNIARTLSSIGYYAYTESEDALFVHLYIAGSLKKQVGDETASIEIESGFPWNGNASVKVSGCNSEFTVAFRIPEWAKSTELTLNGKEMGIDESGSFNDGYLYIKRIWKGDDVLSLRFEMATDFLYADSRIREDIGKVALKRGPIIYCLEEQDNGKGLHLLKVNTDEMPKVRDIEILDTKVVGIEASGVRLSQEYTDSDKAYRLIKNVKKIPVTLKYIPYYTWANRGENEMCVWVREL